MVSVRGGDEIGRRELLVMVGLEGWAVKAPECFGRHYESCGVQESVATPATTSAALWGPLDRFQSCYQVLERPCSILCEREDSRITTQMYTNSETVVACVHIYYTQP